MTRSLRIHFVCSPFAGHLHPQLEIASRLRRVTDDRIHFLSTPAAARSIELCGFSWTPLLVQHHETISRIAHSPQRVGSHPLRLLDQLRDNLSMMDQLVEELNAYWEKDRPDLVIVDFAVPVAGLLARSMGIPWWTSFTAVCAMETPDGVPTYLGGWQPREGVLGKLRDSVGRQLIRGFKRSVHWLFRKRLRKLGIDRVYREDGYEKIYSPERILAWQPIEFEFACTWPASTVFLGPLTSSPPFPHEPPTFIEGKQHVLVSLGTHVHWAKQSAAELVRAVAREMPDVVFHFSHGNAQASDGLRSGNFHEYGYIPYDLYMGRYDLSINHGGTGVLFSCLRHEVPILVWPQDFDQFDHAARLVHHGLGFRCRPRVTDLVTDIHNLATDQSVRANLKKMRQSLENYAPDKVVLGLLDALR